jgi:gamma-glutamylcyclotransferase (GGCT)/AIG2-like uncharacterized protein YtfP
VSTTGPAAVFVYGTLMPGRLRWPLLELHATRHRDAAVHGRLFDTGHGWPAASFDADAATTVPGVLVELRDEHLDDLLAELDLVEGVDHGHYERVVVTTTDGSAAWAWSTLQDTTSHTPIDAWITLDER